jgi:uncharacterized OB-fold protein
MMSAPGYVRTAPQHHRLEAGKCKQCGKIYFPPRLVCHDCHGREFDTVRLSREGKVVTFTVIRVPPAQFADQAPYAMGLIEVEPGVRVMTQIVDCDLDDVEIGMSVRLEFRKVLEDGEAGIIAYGYKAVPVQ